VKQKLMNCGLLNRNVKEASLLCLAALMLAALLAADARSSFVWPLYQTSRFFS